MQVSEIKVKEGDMVKEDAVLIKTTAGDEIKSKISGEVVNINVEENAQVMAGINLLEIVDYNNLEIKVKVDEYDIASLEKGKESTVKIGDIKT
jgi:HlyD family secretion protein